MKIPKARKLPSGSWFIQLRIDGQSVPVTAQTERECKRRAELLKAECRNGKKIDVSASMTLSRAIDQYIKNRDGILSPSTIYGYRIIQRTRFKTAMGKKMTSSGWKSLCNAEAKICSSKTLKNAYRFICSVLRENGIQPEHVNLPQVVPAERPWLDHEQILTFLDAVRGEKCEMPALLALHSLRRSEILALDINENISTEFNRIIVKGAVVPDDNKKMVYKATNKNTSSARIVPIMIPRLSELAKEYRLAGLKITSCTPNATYTQINKACRENGLPEVGWHGLRHSFASLAYHVGMSELEAMEIGGWADQTTMHRIYTHLAQADKTLAENKMAQFYKNANENANMV
ncbi:MAG: site-specific integrase [Clostridiales bacterium]|nr:site-specific integrase [Clostridiales bacterium]